MSALGLVLGVPALGGGGGWTRTIDAFTQTVSETNLIANGSMEAGDPPTGFEAGAAAVLASVAEERTGGSGSKSLGVTMGASAGPYALSAAFTRTVGKWYIMRAWMRNVDTTQGCHMRWLDTTSKLAPEDAPYHTATDWIEAEIIRRAASTSSSTQTRFYPSSSAATQEGASALQDDLSVYLITLNTQATMPSADMQVEVDFTLPASNTRIFQGIHVFYRITGTLESAAQYWQAQIRRNDTCTAWDMRLLLVNGNTETEKIEVTGIGTPDSLRLKCIGSEHRIYTRESAVWTQRGDAVTDATYNDQTGVNVITSPGVTVTALRGSRPSPF